MIQNRIVWPKATAEGSDDDTWEVGDGRDQSALFDTTQQFRAFCQAVLYATEPPPA